MSGNLPHLFAVFHCQVSSCVQHDLSWRIRPTAHCFSCLCLAAWAPFCLAHPHNRLCGFCGFVGIVGHCNHTVSLESIGIMVSPLVFYSSPVRLLLVQQQLLAIVMKVPKSRISRD